MNNNKGFTLIEILLALAILGVGLVGILSVFAVGTNSIHRTVALTEAGFIAQIVLEDFKRQAYTDPGSVNVPDEYKNYYKNYEVIFDNPESIGDPPNLYKVDISVKKVNSSKSLAEFTTYLTRYEP